MSLTDDIFRELWDGLEKNLDWSEFLARHSASKGPLYNAIGRFFTVVGKEIRVLKEEKSRVQSELDQAGLRLDSLNRKIKEAEANVASLEGREDSLSEQVSALEDRLVEKSELVKHLADLEGNGFDIGKLRQLQEALRGTGVKHGLKGKEDVSKFFDALKDYESLLGAEFQSDPNRDKKIGG